MSFFYVKSGGTASGDAGRETVARTGSYATMGASAYYPSVDDALSTPTTPPVAGDIIFISDQTAHNYTATATLPGPSGTGNPLLVVSCDDTAVETPKAGASETTDVGFDIDFSGAWSTWGYTIEPGDDLAINAANTNLLMQNGSVLFEGASDKVFTNGDGITLQFVDMIIDFNTNGSQTGFDLVGGGSKCDLVGGKVIASVGTTIDRLITGSIADSGGGSFSAKGTDLSAVGGAAGRFILAAAGGSATDDAIEVLIDGCKMNATITDVEENFLYPNQNYTRTRSSDSSGAAEHQFYHKNYRGEVEDNTTTFRAASIAFPDSGSKISLKITPDSLCDRLSPFIFEIPVGFAALSNVASDTLQFFITSGTQLTDADIWAEVHYPDGTTKELYIGASSALQISPSYAIDPLGTGNVLPTDASWTSGLTFQQTLKVDTSGTPGADSAPIVRIYVATTAIVHIDPVFDAVAS